MTTKGNDFDDFGPFDDSDFDDFGVVQSIGQHRPYGAVINFPIPFPWGDMIFAGGPYRARPEDPKYFGIKVAQEVKQPYSLQIPISDFSVPSDPAQVEKVLLAGIVAARTGSIPYVGCMGGMGRTGTVLALFAKVALELSRPRIFGIPFGRVADPVVWIRNHYRPEAVETAEQEQFVRGFDTRRVQRVLKGLY